MMISVQRHEQVLSCFTHKNGTECIRQIQSTHQLSSGPNYVVKPSTPNKYRPKFGWVVILGMLILYWNNWIADLTPKFWNGGAGDPMLL